MDQTRKSDPRRRPAPDRAVDDKPKPASDATTAAPGTPPIPSLPKGGGAIRGIGEKFSANPVTGTASLQMASLELGDGRDPKLASSAHGTGEGLLLPGEPPCALIRTDTVDPAERDLGLGVEPVLEEVVVVATVGVRTALGRPTVRQAGDEVVEPVRVVEWAEGLR